jgi:serine/threonine protein kinase
MQASEGPDAKNLVLVDFGLAKKFQNSKGEHIKFKDGKPLTGTARYASCNVHRGYEQSRRDDMEALAYLFIYFLKGTLPWMNLKAANLVEKYDSIRIKKLELSADEVCQGFPVQFERYL